MENDVLNPPEYCVKFQDYSTVFPDIVIQHGNRE
jgi:hypothetical protein